MASLVIALFFLRFWRDAGDRFFLYFALSFLIEGRAPAGLDGIVVCRPRRSPTHYLIRLLAYGLILWAILEKNWPRGKRGRRVLTAPAIALGRRRRGRPDHGVHIQRAIDSGEPTESTVRVRAADGAIPFGHLARPGPAATATASRSACAASIVDVTRERNRAGRTARQRGALPHPVRGDRRRRLHHRDAVRRAGQPCRLPFPRNEPRLRQAHRPGRRGRQDHARTGAGARPHWFETLRPGGPHRRTGALRK